MKSVFETWKEQTMKALMKCTTVKSLIKCLKDELESYEDVRDEK